MLRTAQGDWGLVLGTTNTSMGVFSLPLIRGSHLITNKRKVKNETPNSSLKKPLTFFLSLFVFLLKYWCLMLSAILALS